MSVTSGTGKWYAYVGFQTKEVPVNRQQTLNVTLSSKPNSLNDIVAVGYGTRKRSDVTGAIAGINQKEIEDRPVSDALQAMQGKVAGVDAARENVYQNERVELSYL